MLRFHYAPAPIRNKERLCGLTDYLQKKICPLVYLSAPPVPGHGANPAANKFETVIELDSRDVLSVESQLENVTTPETWLADVQKIQAEIVGKAWEATVTDGIEDTVKSGIDETVEVDATVKFGIEETATVEDSSAIAVPELLELSDELLTALLQTERTTAKVHTKTSCHRRFFQDSDMTDPLIDVNKPPLVPLRFPRGCIAEWCQNACGASVSGLQQVGFPDQADR